jgi:hypothetical protein
MSRQAWCGCCAAESSHGSAAGTGTWRETMAAQTNGGRRVGVGAGRQWRRAAPCDRRVNRRHLGILSGKMPIGCSLAAPSWDYKQLYTLTQVTIHV